MRSYPVLRASPCMGRRAAGGWAASCRSSFARVESGREVVEEEDKDDAESKEEGWLGSHWKSTSGAWLMACSWNHATRDLRSCREASSYSPVCQVPGTPSRKSSGWDQSGSPGVSEWRSGTLKSKTFRSRKLHTLDCASSLEGARSSFAYRFYSIAATDRAPPTTVPTAPFCHLSLSVLQNECTQSS